MTPSHSRYWEPGVLALAHRPLPFQPAYAELLEATFHVPYSMPYVSSTRTEIPLNRSVSASRLPLRLPMAVWGTSDSHPLKVVEQRDFVQVAVDELANTA